MTDEISESLVRKLLSQGTDLKASNEAVALVSEFLKVFLQEAHHRASIEVGLFLLLQQELLLTILFKKLSHSLGGL